MTFSPPGLCSDGLFIYFHFHRGAHKNMRMGLLWEAQDLSSVASCFAQLPLETHKQEKMIHSFFSP